jgi:uncharacterized lipoprotein YehR (DUF1307 family)
MKNCKLLLVPILVFCFLVGCGDSEFDSNYEIFKESYVLATDFVGKEDDSLKAIKDMDIKVVEVELKRMKEAMDNMNTESKSKDEKGIYGNVKNYYQGIEFLLYAAKNIDELSTDEKRKVYTESILASMNRDKLGGVKSDG